MTIVNGIGHKYVKYLMFINDSDEQMDIGNARMSKM